MISARERKILCSNRRARHEYQIEEVIEAGIALTGTEVKSLREGKADLKDSHAAIETGEAYLVGCHISPYTAGNRFNPDPNRTRKLLLHREEVMRLMGKVQEKRPYVDPAECLCGETKDQGRTGAGPREKAVR